MNQWLAVGAVAAGGALGSVLRFAVGAWFLQRAGAVFPWGTLTVNLTGAFLIGAVLQVVQTKTGMSPYARVFLATGILGGYTTFSAFAYETYALGRDALAISVLYGFGSVIAGVAAVFAGIMVARAALP